MQRGRIGPPLRPAPRRNRSDLP